MWEVNCKKTDKNESIYGIRKSRKDKDVEVEQE